MTKTFALLATAALIGLTAPAFAQNAATPSTTESKASTETTSPAGTVSDESKTKTTVESSGDTSTTTKTEHVNDPKGLMNETKTTTEDSAKKKGAKVTKKHKKKVDGKTVESKETTTDAPAAPAAQ